MPYEDPGHAMMQAAASIAAAINDFNEQFARYILLLERRENRLDVMTRAARELADADDQGRYNARTADFLRRNARNLEDYRGRNSDLGDNVEPFPKID
jgi:hypothetical protein